MISVEIILKFLITPLHKRRTMAVNTTQSIKAHGHYSNIREIRSRWNYQLVRKSKKGNQDREKITSKAVSLRSPCLIQIFFADTSAI